MKKAVGVLLASMVLALAFMAQAEYRKYDVKSGVITFEVVTTMKGFGMKGKQVVYFDDYGMKECRETYEEGVLKDVALSDGKELYTLKPQEKKAFKRGPAYRGTEMRIEYSEMGTKKSFAAGLVKKLPAMTIAGQTCEVIEVKARRGDDVTRYAGWSKAMVYMKNTSRSMTVEIKATKIEPNASVPGDKFRVPAGFSVENAK